MFVFKAAVVGAGTMGGEIAQVMASADVPVVLKDVDRKFIDQGLEKARQVTEAQLGRLVKKEKLTQEQADAQLEEVVGRIQGTTEYEGFGDVDFVVEAVPEKMEVKQAVFGELDAVTPGHAILASNTSSLPISAIAAAARHPARVIGLHFFNPVPVMKLLEIVQGERTDPMVVTACRAVGGRLGKEVVVVRDAPGFATSRLGIALALEAMRMVEEGVASVEEIDRAIELGYGHPMGPLKLTDHVGLDVRLAIADHLLAELGERFRPPQILRRMVRAGKLGKKTGEGFYKY